ncbi:pickpocket protein 11-like [Lucilia sericata]|uniref:pickpocket protein 11-like n=1 Tax=Lucilia sericata TaxID=13632 RepID=UPI0018A84F68|nr:pickpocket protein 11-like [Lucilia sericata]
MAKTISSNKTEKSSAEITYYLTFEDYLKPKSVKKPNQLLFNQNSSTNSQMRLKLLEHPVLIAGRKSNYQLLKEKLQKLFHSKKKRTLKLPTNSSCKVDISKIASIWHNKTFNKPSRLALGSIQLPAFLAFLKARNDDGLCKRKSGFEIYCEMASIHGFINFVGATTWQRAFWFLVVLTAVVMSGFILLLSHFMNTNTPTILYSESTQYPTWSIPFPAVTICNLNRISKRRAEYLAQKFEKTSNMSIPELNDYFNSALATAFNLKATTGDQKTLTALLKLNNYSLPQLLNELTPNCENELLRCKWQGHFIRCKHLFQKIQTAYGSCCSFNYKALQKTTNKRTDYVKNHYLEYSTSCGYKTGLSVLLDPHLENYKASLTLSPGFLVLIHDSHDFADTSSLKRIIQPSTFNKIHVLPQQTHATSYIARESLHKRKCYLPWERPMYYFGSYSQVNCLAECRSLKLYQKCKCSLANWPRKDNWTVCGLEESKCYLKLKGLISALLVAEINLSKNHHIGDQFMCDCYPLCDFNMYSISMDSGRLMRKYSLTDLRFFKDINTTNHILLHVFFGELYAERLRLDVYENWLSFIGTFGGITGLYMGYSFVSGFELIFFVFVRPACNWLTKKQIRYRIKKRQQKAQKEAEHRKQLEEEKAKQERIEAFLRMRPYCPEYVG